MLPFGLLSACARLLPLRGGINLPDTDPEDDSATPICVSVDESR